MAIERKPPSTPFERNMTEQIEATLKLCEDKNHKVLIVGIYIERTDDPNQVNLGLTSEASETTTYADGLCFMEGLEREIRRLKEALKT